MLNMVLVQGRPTTDVELIWTRDKKQQFCAFKIAINRWRGKNLPPITVYPNVICFGAMARKVVKELAKGAFCTIVGRIVPDLSQRRETFCIEIVDIFIHENLRNDTSLQALTLSDNPAEEAILPKGMVSDLFDAMEITTSMYDEDMPR